MQLQGKFIAISVPALTIALVLIGGIVYSKLVKEKQESLEMQMTTASELIGMRVDSMIRKVQTSTSLLKEAAPIIDWFDKVENPVLGPRAELEVRMLFEKVIETQPDFREIRLVDVEGYGRIWVANNTLLNQTQDEQGSAWFSKLALNPGAETIVSIANHSGDGATTVTVSSAVYVDPRDSSTKKAIAGYVVIDLLVETFAYNLSKRTMRDNGYVVLMNEDLDIIHVPDAHLEGAKSIQKYLLSANSSLVNNGRIEQVEIGGQTCMLGQHVVRDGLIALIVSPPSTLQTMRGEIFKTVGLATVTVIVLFSLFFSWLVRWIVVTPISRLQANVTELSKGRPESTRQSTRNDEIGQLARSFTHLNTQLSVSMQQLRETCLRNEKLAHHDGLTGLPNRRQFKTLLHNTLENAADTASSFAVMFIDLNNFKRLNDTTGHQAGDELLVITGKRLKQTFEQLSKNFSRAHPDLVFDVARLAGDEFVVLLSGFKNTAFVHIAADLLLANLCQPATVENTQWPLEASVGVGLYPDHATDGMSLLACADLAMYEAKREQTSCWRLYTHNMGGESHSQAA